MILTSSYPIEVSAGLVTGVVAGNSAICADSICTLGRAGINFYYCPNPLARVFFAASFVCGTLGAVSSGAALLLSTWGIPTIAVLSSFSARSFNRLGKDTLRMGHITNGNITTANEIAALMS